MVVYFTFMIVSILAAVQLGRMTDSESLSGAIVIGVVSGFTIDGFGIVKKYLKFIDRCERKGWSVGFKDVAFRMDIMRKLHVIKIPSKAVFNREMSGPVVYNNDLE